MTSEADRQNAGRLGACVAPFTGRWLELWPGRFGQVAALDEGPGSVMGYAVSVLTPD